MNTLLMLWLAAAPPPQPLPAPLGTVTLRIAKTESATGDAVYVVTLNSFDPKRAGRAQTLYHGKKASALKGPHMERIARLLALDTQRVFVLPERSRVNDDEQRAALLAAGVRLGS